MHKNRLTLATALIFAGHAYGGSNAAPIYQTAPHRFDAAIQANDITKYSINLMWVNRTLDPNQRYLSSAKDEEGLVNQLLAPAIKWAKANPLAGVSLWYDGAMATREAVLATQVALDQCLHHDNVVNIRLRNVRDLPIVQKNPDAFSDQIPIYFRVDILKPILVVNAIENENNQAAIYADLEVGDWRSDGQRMSKAELFDANTIISLSKHGLLLNNDTNRPENQFFQLLNNKRMLYAIKHAIINANLMRACTALNSKDKSWVTGLGSAVFYSTISDVFNLYKGTADGVHIKIRPDLIHQGSETDAWIDYDPKIHGYSPFGLYFSDRLKQAVGMDEKGNLLPQEKMIKFPFPAVRWGPGRKVQVRGGNDHVTFAKDLVPRAPAAGGTVYHCELWN